MRVPLIAGNWKMNTTLREATELVAGMLRELDEIGNVDKVLCPPFISLAAVRELIKGSSIKLGAQNLYHEEKGAYTGEVSPMMVADLCEFVIIGHSERRQYFNETGEVVVLKAGGDKFEIIFQTQINEAPIQSSIAIANGHLFIRTAENLYCIGK